jgi:hypothetical protein
MIALLPARTRHFLYAAKYMCSDRRYFILDSIQHFSQIANVRKDFQGKLKHTLSIHLSKLSG